MHNLKMTGHILLYDGFAAATIVTNPNRQTAIPPGREKEEYVPPFTGLQAISATPVVTQALDGVSTKVTTTRK